MDSDSDNISESNGEHGDDNEGGKWAELLRNMKHITEVIMMIRTRMTTMVYQMVISMRRKMVEEVRKVKAMLAAINRLKLRD